MDYVDCLWSRDPTNGQERISEARGSKLRFIVNGASPAKDSALASAGAELRFGNAIALLGKFDGEFASRSNTYAGTGTLRVSW